MKATDDPPSLSHIADKTTREWIYAWLKDPQAYAATATMPNFKLSDDDARDISAFLISNSTPQPGDTARALGKGMRPIPQPAPACTANPSAPPATRFRMPPAILWAAMLARS